MFDITKIRESYCLNNQTLINELQKENPLAQINICGSNRVVIHCNADGSGICLDYNDLLDDECYDEYLNPDDIPDIEPFTVETKQNIGNELPKELVNEVVNKLKCRKLLCSEEGSCNEKTTQSKC